MSGVELSIVSVFYRCQTRFYFNDTVNDNQEKESTTVQTKYYFDNFFFFVKSYFITKKPNE